MIKNKLKESVLWDDLTDVEKIAYEYANDYINKGYSIEHAVTQGCFDMMNNIDDNDDIDDYEDPDPRKIKKFLMHKYKAPFGRKSNKENKPLYIIKDNHGNQLSAPSEDDYELWDRVAAMEARGKRGLSVVAYTESLSEVLDDKGVERYGVDGEWWYFTTHGVQPGSVPKGIKILNIIDTANGTYFCSDRVLNTSELRQFDIKEKYPNGLVDESLKESTDKYFKIGGYYSGGIENGISIDRVEIYDIVSASNLDEAKDILKSLLTSQEKYRLKNDYNNNFDDFMSGENYFIAPATEEEFEDFNNGIFKESFNMKVKNFMLNKQFRKDKSINEGLLDHPYDKYYEDFLSKNKDLFKVLEKLVSHDCKEVWDSYYNFCEIFKSWASKALDNDSLLSEELNEDTINKQFRKDIKNKYKSN